MQEPFQNHFHVVLVEPENSLNIGAVARAMMNLGFSHLHLVAPPQFALDRAGVTARNASALLETLQIHETLADAVSNQENVVGLSLRPGKTPARFLTLPEWSSTLPFGIPQNTALVFGPEDNGLRQEHLNLCRWIIRIPSTTAFAEFNLAQSVLVVLYELARVLSSEGIPQPERTADALPTWNDFVQLDRMLDSVMQESGFVRPGSPVPTPDKVKNLFRRLEMNAQEMGMMMALFSRIDKTLERRRDDGEQGD
jgi:TrmH family RNA methyltransferase